MKFICAQPAIPYYTWQVEVMINNFIRNGVNPNDIHIVSAFKNQISQEWLNLQKTYSSVGFFFYEDTRDNPCYIPSIRPHILHKHWIANPYLENETILYHDCDIILARPLDIKNEIEDDICYVADTISYIGANYIRSKGEKYLDLMSLIVKVDKNKIIAEERNSGGAQYLLKNIKSEFWIKVYLDCELMYKHVNIEIQKDKVTNPSYHEIQIWCSDMWAVLWNLWYYNKQVKVTPKLSFSWATSPIHEWFNHPIYHNAGVTDGNSKMFYKAAYMNSVPYNDVKLENLSDKHCSYKYAEEIINTSKISALL
jgi:hypothetical protein